MLDFNCNFIVGSRRLLWLLVLIRWGINLVWLQFLGHIISFFLKLTKFRWFFYDALGYLLYYQNYISEWVVWDAESIIFIEHMLMTTKSWKKSNIGNKFSISGQNQWTKLQFSYMYKIIDLRITHLSRVDFRCLWK